MRRFALDQNSGGEISAWVKEPVHTPDAGHTGQSSLSSDVPSAAPGDRTGRRRLRRLRTAAGRARVCPRRDLQFPAGGAKPTQSKVEPTMQARNGEARRDETDQDSPGNTNGLYRDASCQVRWLPSSRPRNFRPNVSKSQRDLRGVTALQEPVFGTGGPARAHHAPGCRMTGRPALGSYFVRMANIAPKSWFRR